VRPPLGGDADRQPKGDRYGEELFHAEILMLNAECRMPNAEGPFDGGPSFDRAALRAGRMLNVRLLTTDY
jgi:hypothetical protein